MEYRHTHFWVMARDIRAYVKKTGLAVLSFDDPNTRTCGFITDIPENDARHRSWRMRLADVSVTANQRENGFEGWSNEDMIRLTHPHLMGSTGRIQVAKMLSTGVLVAT